MNTTENDGVNTTENDPAAAGRARFDPDEQARLETERDFLLRSLDDLEVERAAGDLDGEAYERLRDDYTARAAAVLRAIEGGGARRPVAAPASWRRRLIMAGILTGFAAVTAFLLVAGLGERLPGQTSSGNAQTAGSDPSAREIEAARAALATRRSDLESRVRDNPDDAGAHLELARLLLESGEVAGAVKEYDSAARLDPANAEALAYAGWVVYLVGRQSEGGAGPELTDRALARLDKAVAAAPDYPDAHFFRGMVLFRGKEDPKAAVPEFERFMALVPAGPERDQVGQLLKLARQASAPTPTAPTTP